MKLTQDQINKYNEDGYLILDNVFDHSQIDKVVSEMKSLIDKENINSAISVFTTNEQDRKSDIYFLESGDKIRFFFEASAIKDGKLVVPKEVAFNKVGHALHDLNPVFEEFSYQQKIKDIIYSLDYKKALSVQSMFIFKNPEIGGEVGIHQDSTFLHTTPLTTHALWFAFEDANVENGCLRILPGSHKNGITRRFIRNSTNDGCLFTSNTKEGPFDLKDFVAGECKKGSVILLHGSTVHYSEPNLSKKSRFAYTLHFIEGDESTGVVYESDNWLQRGKDLPFRVL